MGIETALKIIDLVVNVGVPAAQHLFTTWNDDNPGKEITAKDIELYQDKFSTSKLEAMIAYKKSLI